MRNSSTVNSGAFCRQTFCTRAMLVLLLMLSTVHCLAQARSHGGGGGGSSRSKGGGGAVVGLPDNLSHLKESHSMGPPTAVGLNNSVTTVKPGDSAKLACPVPAELFGTRVTWIRRRDLELLAVEENMYSNDPRFFVSHSRHSHYQGARHSQVWFLHLLNVTRSDEGEYECQLSTHPHISTIVHLTVADAFSEILGPPDRMVAAGSNLRLVCSLRNASSPPSFVFWYQGRRMVNYDADRNVKVTEGEGYSILTVKSVSDDHEGNYTCEPSNASPSSVQVHVVQDAETAPGPNTGASGATGPGGGDSVDLDGDDNQGAPGGARKTPVMQLGVKSASSAGPCTIPPSYTSGLGTHAFLVLAATSLVMLVGQSAVSGEGIFKMRPELQQNRNTSKYYSSDMGDLPSTSGIHIRRFRLSTCDRTLQERLQHWQQ